MSGRPENLCYKGGGVEQQSTAVISTSETTIPSYIYAEMMAEYLTLLLLI